MRPLLARETPAHDRDELQQIVEAVLDHIADDREIDDSTSASFLVSSSGSVTGASRQATGTHAG
jgi:hypothetical protein